VCELLPGLPDAAASALREGLGAFRQIDPQPYP